MTPRRLLSAALLAAAPSVALAFSALEGGGARWPQSPTWRLEPPRADVRPEDAHAAVRAAFDTWVAVPEIGLQLAEGGVEAPLTLHFAAPWPGEFGAGVAAIALVQWSEGDITSAEIAFNATSFQWIAGDEAAPLRLDPRPLTDVQGVATHEIGHTLGLGHSRIRGATMYWSGDGFTLRDLDDDDVRGVQFLYAPDLVDGPARAAPCDSCLEDADCGPDGRCLPIEPDRPFCATPCGGGCPNGFECAELGEDGALCRPQSGFCSDTGGRGLPADAYCWGAAQCAAGRPCIAIPGDALCAEACGPDGACEAGRVCVAGIGGGGVCVPPGPGAIGDRCHQPFDCASGVCLPMPDGAFVCSVACGLDADCPEDTACTDLGHPQFAGLCVPAAHAPPPEPDAGIDDRCPGGPCGEPCAPFGDCAPGFGCTPVAGDWRCLTLDGPEPGASCERGGAPCGGGAYCAEPGLGEAPVCLRPCDETAPDTCGPGALCSGAVGPWIGVGACSPGALPPAAPCERDSACASFVCLPAARGRTCTTLCTDANDCNPDAQCGRSGVHRSVCLPAARPDSGLADFDAGAVEPPDAGAVGPPDAGVVALPDARGPAGDAEPMGDATTRTETDAESELIPLPDARPARDAAPADAVESSPRGGGGCRVSPSPRPGWLWLAVALAAGWVRRWRPR